MKTFQLQAHSDQKSTIKLELNAGEPDTDFRVLVTLETINTEPIGARLERYAGTIPFDEDPLEYQRRMREEW
ncbi:MAG: hypothetical protein HS115_20235 [Spirochaetales bacterium]|nr:hypothetical protein [Spirochaetales bacterium]